MSARRWFPILLLLAAAGAALAVPVPDHETRRARQTELGDVSRMPGRARRALFAAREMRDRGEPAAAAEKLAAELAEHPDLDHHLLRHLRGDCLFRAGDHERALAEQRAAADLSPDFAAAWLASARTAYELSRYGQAAEGFERGFRLDPDPDPAWLHYAAVASLLDERPAEAVTLLRELVDGAYGPPRLAWCRDLAAAAVEAGDTVAAAAAADTICARFPDDPEAWLTAYRVHALAGDNARAAVALTMVGYLRPLERAEAATLGDLYFALNAPALAGRYYEVAVDASASVDDYERLSSAWLAARDERRAAETLDRGLARFPSARLWSLLGDLRLMQSDHEAAYEAYRESAALDPAAGRVQLMLGWCALETDRPEEAIAALEQAMADSSQIKAAESLLTRAHRSIKF